MKPISFLCSILILWCLPYLALAQALEYQLNELPEDVHKNILAHLGTAPETELERSAFIYAADKRLQDALTSLGYYHSDLDIQIDQNQTPWQMQIEIILNQATLITELEINITGDAAEDEAFITFLAELPISEGQQLHHGVYEEVKVSIRSLGQERGYFDGLLNNSHIAVNRNLRTATIQINYESGTRYRFGEISFDHSSISKLLLDELIPFKTGDYYLTSLLYRFQNDLQQTGYFSNTLVLPDRESAIDYLVPIKVSQSIVKRHYFDLGFGYATDTQARLSFGWRMPLVNQYGHSLAAKIEYSEINPLGRFTYTVPLSHPLNDAMQYQIMLEDDEYGDIDSKYFSARVGRIKNKNGWIRNYYLRYLDEEWNYSDVYDDGVYLLPGLSYSKTRRKGSALDPSSGFTQIYSAEAGHSSLGSELTLLRLTAQWRLVRTLSLRHRFVARAELGSNIIDSDDDYSLAPSLRFYAGGDQSIRGFKYQSLGPSDVIKNGPNAGEEIVIGGQNLAVASLEYQYYLNQKWRVALFTDAGNAFDNSNFKAEYSIGTGLHWLSPVGAIRLDLGYSLSADDPSFRIHINLGAEL